jgi:hypothetical protein
MGKIFCPKRLSMGTVSGLGPVLPGRRTGDHKFSREDSHVQGQPHHRSDPRHREDEERECAPAVPERVRLLHKTRLGLHEASEDYCSANGIIILEMIDKSDKARELTAKLDAIDGLTTRTIVFDHACS